HRDRRPAWHRSCGSFLQPDLPRRAAAAILSTCLGMRNREVRGAQRNCDVLFRRDPLVSFVETGRAGECRTDKGADMRNRIGAVAAALVVFTMLGAAARADDDQKLKDMQYQSCVTRSANGSGPGDTPDEIATNCRCL